MKNDNNNLFELQNFECENRLLNFRVGKRVGARPITTLNLFQDDVFFYFHHFDTELMGAACRGKKL